ncbi:MAG: hypothetical protein Q8K86_08265 [Candidatus Nanopelagicaceae bacterium]|nr:hypothetical protein [Candidatus Nanopelagicaceae bacterium]
MSTLQIDTRKSMPLQAMTDAIFYYVASSDDSGFEVPEVESKEQLKDFASRIVAHLSSKFQIDEDEASDKVERIIQSFMLG